MKKILCDVIIVNLHQNVFHIFQLTHNKRRSNIGIFDKYKVRIEKHADTDDFCQTLFSENNETNKFSNEPFKEFASNKFSESSVIIRQYNIIYLLVYADVVIYHRHDFLSAKF